jgi:hypothetical protein
VDPERLKLHFPRLHPRDAVELVEQSDRQLSTLLFGHDGFQSLTKAIVVVCIFQCPTHALDFKRAILYLPPENAPSVNGEPQELREQAVVRSKLPYAGLVLDSQSQARAGD